MELGYDGKSISGMAYQDSIDNSDRSQKASAN